MPKLPKEMLVPKGVVARESRLLKGPETEPPWFFTVKVTEMFWPGIAEEGVKVTAVTVRSGQPAVLV